METKTSKVKNALLKKQWEGRNGTMFDFNVEFENGDKGVYITKSNPQEVFVQGQEITYTIEKVSKNGYENVVVKPVLIEKSGNFGKSVPKNYKADFISFAASYAKDLVVGGKSELKDFRSTFNEIYNVMSEKLAEINGEKSSSNGQETK